MLQIVGVITATSFVHQTDPNREGNMSRTLKTWAFDTDHRRHQVPFVTGNSLRGQLRRQAAEIALDALNKPVSRALFSCMTSGKASRKDIGLPPTTTAVVEGGRNVFAGLFGGGGYMLPSRYTMGPLWPVVAWCHAWLHPALRDQMVPAEKLTFESGHDIPLVTEIILTSRDDVMAGKGQDRIEDYQKSFEAWVSGVSAGRAAKAANKASQAEAKKKGEKVDAGDGKAISVDVSGFNLVEAIIPGTPLQFWLRVHSEATEAQIGLMLLAIRNWANENVIGGASARGFGRFEAQLALYDDEQELVPNIFNLDGHATAYTLHDDVSSYVKAAEAALAALTVADLEGAYATDVAGV